MKNMKLFPKTYIHTLCLIVSMVLIVFVLIYNLLPTFYRKYKQKEVETQTKELAQQSELLSSEQLANKISSYAMAKGCGYTAVYENGEIICHGGAGIVFENVEDLSDIGTEDTIQFDVDVVESTTQFQTSDGKKVWLTLTMSLQPIDDALSVLLLMMPFSFVICLLVSAAFAYFYAKSITRPIRNMSQATEAMAVLTPDVSCTVDRTDEIGILAHNINDMYEKLLATISDLEQEVETVSKAEQEKLDFLLLASHELKTPVTAVRGMIEGMIYNVGIYKDRDTYLKECQKSLENLTELICRILETSKMDITAAANKKEQADVGMLIKEAAEPYLMIAQRNNANVKLLSEEKLYACIPTELVKKVFSNVISNAVKFTKSGHTIRIYIKNRSVVMENECEPLTDEVLSHIGEPFYHPCDSAANNSSTGLGLYLTDRILNACALTYDFTAYENGMRFTLYL